MVKRFQKVPLLRRPKITRMSNKCKKFEKGEDEKVKMHTPLSYYLFQLYIHPNSLIITYQ